jgi:hypothetical protein
MTVSIIWQQWRRIQITVLSEFKNKDPLCTQWAVDGWCDEDPNFMDNHCCPVCWSAAQLVLHDRFVIDFGVRQSLDSKEHLKAYNEGIDYLAAMANNLDLGHILSKCKNKDQL